jgi:RNA polymerase sigma-70 factor (ECF subfamily)
MAVLTELEEAVPALRRYAWSLLRHTHDADDLVQDCLVRALDGLAQRTGTAALRPWLFTIMHHQFVSNWRRRRRHARLFTDHLAAAAVTAREPSQDWSLATRDLIRCFDLLSEDQRQVMLLVAVEGLAYQDVATILRIPIGTVMSRLSRGRDALRTHMDGEHAAHPARHPVMLRRVT